MRLTEASNNTSKQFKGEANSIGELFASIEDGRFTLDGRKLVVRDTLSFAMWGLTSLIGSPQRVQGGFICTYNKLKTLEGAPQEVGGFFICANNQLETLEGGPVKVGSFYDCSSNKLITLKGLPQEIRGDLWCYNNQLTSLEGCARVIYGSLYAHNNKLLTSIEGGPSFVEGDVNLKDCPKLISLQNIHHYFKEVHGCFYLNGAIIKKHLLGLLLIRKLLCVALDDVKLEAILRKHLSLKSHSDLLAQALELAEAGYEEQAKL
jgi:hypothetical protein